MYFYDLSPNPNQSLGTIAALSSGIVSPPQHLPRIPAPGNRTLAVTIRVMRADHTGNPDEHPNTSGTIILGSSGLTLAKSEQLAAS